MKFSIAAVIAAAAAGVSASAYSNVTYTTEIVTALTTYCPEATKITHGGKTYTITKATTLTITDCPCTISKPVYVSKVVECTTSAYVNITHPTEVPVPVVYTTPVPVGHTTPVPVAYTAPVGTGYATPTVAKPPMATAGAGKIVTLSGAGLAAAVGLAAFIL